MLNFFFEKHRLINRFILKLKKLFAINNCKRKKSYDIINRLINFFFLLSLVGNPGLTEIHDLKIITVTLVGSCICRAYNVWNVNTLIYIYLCKYNCVYIWVHSIKTSLKKLLNIFSFEASGKAHSFEMYHTYVCIVLHIYTIVYRVFFWKYRIS